MMPSKSKLSISVNSTSSVVGNIAQGDKNTLNADITNQREASASALAILFEQIRHAANEADVAEEELKELQAQVTELHEKSKEKGFLEKSGSVLKLLYKAYGWAEKPLRHFFGV